MIESVLNIKTGCLIGSHLHCEGQYMMCHRPSSCPSDARCVPFESTVQSFSLSTRHPGLLEGLHLLVVDDSYDNQVLLLRLLQKAGADVTLAENGKEAMELALTQPVDAVVMDIQMPVMDGIQATQSLRRQGFDQPILALTAHGRHGDRERSLQLGFSEHLDKPIQVRHLIETIFRLTSRNSNLPQA